MDFLDKTCKDCVFFQRQVDPNNLGNRSGLCRHSKHVLGLPVQTPGGVSMELRTVFITIPEIDPACGHFEQRVAVSNGAIVRQ